MLNASSNFRTLVFIHDPEQMMSSKDISITDYKNRMIQKNFYTRLFTPLPSTTNVSGVQ